ncbi:MAG TPA: hypothetical protein VGM83_09595 [Devosiaceae bacterium]|jgi:hypothetical protein
MAEMCHSTFSTVRCRPFSTWGLGALNWKWAAGAKAGNLHEAAEDLRVTGTTAGGRTLPGLITRRREEAELIEFGDYTIGASINPLANGVLQRGERRAPVTMLQQSLTKRGYTRNIHAGQLVHALGEMATLRLGM